MCKVIFVIKYCLISPILDEGSTLINLGFLIMEDFWYLVVILDFTGLNDCILLTFVWKFLAKSKKFRKVDAITSVLRKIQNPIKFERVLRCRLKLKTELPKFYLQLWRTIFGSKLEFRETRSETARFSKILTFYKIWTLRSRFCKFNPKRP